MVACPPQPSAAASTCARPPSPPYDRRRPVEDALNRAGFLVLDIGLGMPGRRSELSGLLGRHRCAASQSRLQVWPAKTTLPHAPHALVYPIPFTRSCKLHLYPIPNRVIGHPAVRARVERRSTPTRLTIPSMHPTPTCLTIPSMRSCKLHLVRPSYRPQLIHSVDGVFSVIIHCRRPTHHKAPAAAFRELSCRDSPSFAHASRFQTGSRRPHRGGDLGTSYSTRHNRL